ncbi:IclR family transcriptional regulator domain-containing protein [Streptomyces viridiviolaceus]
MGRGVPPGEGGPESLPALRAFTDRTIVRRGLLAEELDRVRAQRFALNDGESALGIRTIAVPVLDHVESARFALAVRGTPELVTDDRRDWFLDQARVCARALEVLLLPPRERGVAAVR